MNIHGIRNDYVQKLLYKYDLNVAKLSDFYSPLPDISKLKQNKKRWNKPSELIGINFDINQMKDSIDYYVDKYYNEYKEIKSWDELKNMGYGPGIPEVDCFILYCKIRELKPKRYIEIGCGLSSYYASVAKEKNEIEGNNLEIICIEPFPYEKLSKNENIQLLKEEIQNIRLSLFDSLIDGDILFIDTTHILKIDGDVPYIYLEILPRLKNNINIHIHDIPFPYNIPFPSDLWILNRRWPMFWNEAMMVQAFLAFNNDYVIDLSLPIIRYNDEEFLMKNLPIYRNLQDSINTFSSLWIKTKKNN